VAVAGRRRITGGGVEEGEEGKGLQQKKNGKQKNENKDKNKDAAVCRAGGCRLIRASSTHAGVRRLPGGACIAPPRGASKTKKTSPSLLLFSPSLFSPSFFPPPSSLSPPAPSPPPLSPPSSDDDDQEREEEEEEEEEEDDDDDDDDNGHKTAAARATASFGGGAAVAAAAALAPHSPSTALSFSKVAGSTQRKRSFTAAGPRPCFEKWKTKKMVRKDSFCHCFA
jgi:hypothetical protein